MDLYEREDVATAVNFLLDRQASTVANANEKVAQVAFKAF